jgi:tRNA dimethylallyltransferase
MNQDITCIIGPTAIGKSATAIELAKQTQAHIISADAFQIYKGLDIGTAKVLPDEQDGVPHYLIDIKEPHEHYSVAEFIKETNTIITSCRKQNIPIIICGGTGLYVRSFLYEYTFPDSSDTSLRNDIEARGNEIGPKALWKELNKKDPKAAEKIPYQNMRRTIRALEVIATTGKLFSAASTQTESPRLDTRVIGLTADRDVIIDRINRRVDIMIENGLIDEVKTLLAKGVPETAQAFEGIGYKETIQYLNGSLSKSEMIDLIKIKTRQFSKRQMTWFRRLENVHWQTIAD